MLRGLLLVAVAAVSWGTTGAVTTILVSWTGIGALTIGAVRMWVAAGFLWLLAGVAGSALRLTRADLARCALMGVCMAVFQVTFFTAVTLIGVALPSLFAICSAPILIALFAALWLGERLTAGAPVALALGIAGAALLVAGPGGSASSPFAFAAGAALGLTAGLSYAVYVVIAKWTLTAASASAPSPRPRGEEVLGVTPLSPGALEVRGGMGGGASPLPHSNHPDLGDCTSSPTRESSPLVVTAATFTAAALLLTPTLFLAPNLFHELAVGWPLLLYVGAVATAGAYALYTLGLRHVSAGVAGIVALLEPLTATLLGVMAFGERLGVTGALGAVLLFASIAILVQGQAAAARREPQVSPR